MKERETSILSQIYNLILNPETLSSERTALLLFKRLVTSGEDFETELIKLSNSLGKIAVTQSARQKSLSRGVAALYRQIQFDGEKKRVNQLGDVMIPFGS